MAAASEKRPSVNRPAFSIWTAQLRDLPELVRLEQENFHPLDVLTRRQMTYHIRNPRALMLVAGSSHEKKIAGSILALFGPTGYARIYSIAVDKKFQGQGLAGRMIDRVFEEVKSRNSHTLGLEVRATNKPAIALYEKKGFIKKHALPHYYDDGEDGLKMEWKP